MIELTLNETRVLGVLIEKAVTTPDQYPLSLNGLVTGCNQKTNRDPVLSLAEGDVQNAVDSLVKKNLISEVRFGGRVPKYQHRFSGTEFSEYRFNGQETALLCLLFLRGPQTPGELRTRSSRLGKFDDVQQVESVLQGLIDHAGGPYVAKMEREPGRRESRFSHLFSGELMDVAASTQVSASKAVPSMPINDDASTDESLQDRVELLEMTVEELQEQVARLQETLDQLVS